jgi:ketosteroid isomerase-like protein
MSQENVELVRAVYELWATGDFRAAADLVAPGFEWDQRGGVVEPGTHRGPQAEQALRRVFEVYENFRIEAEEYIDAGEKIVVVARSHGTARGSGMQLDQRFAFAWTVHDGELLCMTQYAARDEALKAVGLAD